MLATMLVRSLCRTFRSPNQRISQGWEGKEPASAGFLLAAVLVSYVQYKINKSYQLDTTMKINEIAHSRLDEVNPLNIPGVKPVVKYVGPYFDDAAKAAAKIFGAGKGTTQAELDALRASETGAANAAGGGRQPPTGKHPLSTVSSDELNALLYPPRAAEPTVGSFLKRRGDPGFDPDLSRTQALPGYLQNLPPARIGPVTAPRPSPSGPRPRNATPDLGRAEPELLDSPASREIGQIRPGVEISAPAATSGETRFTLDDVERLAKIFKTNPAAAEEQAKKMGLLGKIGVGGLGLAGLGLGVQGLHMAYPDTIPSVGQMSSKAAGAVSDFVAPIGVNPNGAGPPAGDKPYDPKDFAPSVSQGKDNDPLRKEKDEALRQALSGEIKESTAALDRMIYLSRL